MNADCFYVKGDGKEVCQDYAIALNSPGMSIIIGADGCSSSKDTDIGARLLVHAIKTLITATPLNGDYELFAYHMEKCVLGKLLSLSSMLHLKKDVFDATLWAAVANEKGLYVFGWGDGYIVIKYRNDDSPHFEKVSYTSGAPYYISYGLDRIRDQRYNLEFQGQKIERMWISDNPATEQEGVLKSPRVFFVKREKVEWVSLFSDGADTFKRSFSNTKISEVTILRQLTTYKSFTGEFVKRRMQRFLKDSIKEDIVHFDDLFCASIYFGDL